MRFFKTKPKKGMPISIKGFARGLLKMADALEHLDVVNGHVEWPGGRPMIYTWGSTGSRWSGEAWMNGHHWYAPSIASASGIYGSSITNNSSSNGFLKVDYTGGSFDLEIVDSVSLTGNTCPDGKKYYNLSNVSGDIHFDMP